MTEPEMRAGPATPELCRLDTPAASARLLRLHGVTVATLNKIRTVGGGPRFWKFGRTVRYDPAAVYEWALARLGAPRSSTSEAATRQSEPAP